MQKFIKCLPHEEIHHLPHIFYSSIFSKIFDIHICYIILGFKIQYDLGKFVISELIVEMLADIAHMGNTYFRKLFVEKSGTTPVKYITSQRLIYAEKSLPNGKYTIAQVTEKSDFCNAKYFSR